MYFFEHNPQFQRQPQTPPPYDFYYPMSPAWPGPANTPNQPYGYQTPFEYFQKPEPPGLSYGNNNADPAMYGNMPPKANLMGQFQKEDGQLDLDKVLTTVGQLANTYHQVYPIIQQFNGFLKNFKTGG